MRNMMIEVEPERDRSLQMESARLFFETRQRASGSVAVVRLVIQRHLLYEVNMYMLYIGE